MTGLAESKTRLYAIRTDASSTTVVMSSKGGFMASYCAVFGAVLIGCACSILITPPENWPEFNYSWPGLLGLVVWGLVLLYWGRLSSSVIDLRSITVTPGRATVAWRLFRRSIRSLTFDIRSVVVHQDVWRDGKGSTDRVILQGQEQTHTVATVWNVPPIGSVKPPFNNWPLGAASELLPHGGATDERTVSPLILDLAKTLASAASVPIVLRAGETRRPWITIGGD